MRFIAKTLAAAAAVTALATPATAHAASDYVVTLRDPSPSTCERAILDVTMAYGVSPRSVYTSALCGFSASLSRSKAREISLDPRVEYVQPDSLVTAG